jgi:hypothetical protein
MKTVLWGRLIGVPFGSGGLLIRLPHASSNLHEPMPFRLAALCIALLAALGLSTQTARPMTSAHITSPKEEFGFNIGDHYRLVNCSLEAY